VKQLALIDTSPYTEGQSMVKQSATVHMIVESIKTRIGLAVYQPGSPLPPEADLASDLGVSRGSVRRAIEALIESGEITRKPHSRPIVSERLAQAFRGQGCDVCIWLHNTADSPALPFLGGVSKGLSGSRYSMVVREPSRHLGIGVRAAERRFLEDLLTNSSIAGSIICRDPYAENDDVILKLLERRFPLVFVDTEPPQTDLPFDHVGTANTASARRCVEHLIELGHQHIVCITDSARPRPCADRIRGYERAMAQAGLGQLCRCISAETVDDIGEANEPLAGSYAQALSKDSFYYNLAHKAVAELHRLDTFPTALFITYDLLAYWVCAILEGLGIHVPEHVSVVGFDWRARWNGRISDSLTTASQDFEGFGFHAANLLLDRLESGSAQGQKHVLLDAPLVIRSSTAIPSLAKTMPRIAIDPTSRP